MSRPILTTMYCLVVTFSLVACGKKFNPADGAAPPAQLIETSNASLVTVEKPERFPVIAAESISAPEELNVTGTVNPDISREIPVISLASGRIVDIRARLNDNIKKGDLLLKVQSPDITNAFDTYRKAVNDEHLAQITLQRSRDLFAHGAIPQSQLEQAENVEDNAKADLTAAEQQLDTLGVNRNHPTDIGNVYAPVTGVIIQQNVTEAAAAGVTYSGSATAFVIADLSEVWILCDVYENDLKKVRLGQIASIRLNAYPGKVLSGAVSDIGPILDPNLRTAKVRIEVRNPDNLLRLGMFVTATLASRTKHTYAVVPSAAILHLHDRDWIFVPAGGKQFRRVEVDAGDTLPGGRQEILSGVAAGQKVVTNVLALEETLEAQ